MHTYLDRNDCFRLLSEDVSSIEERRDDVVYEQVDPGLGLLLVIFIGIDGSDHSASDHPIALPQFVILLDLLLLGRDSLALLLLLLLLLAAPVLLPPPPCLCLLLRRALA